MACRDRLSTLLRLADGELSPTAEQEVWKHLRVCVECQHTLDLFQAENAAITQAISPRPVRTARPWFGRIAAAAAAVVLISGALYGLLLVYEQIGSATAPDTAKVSVDLGIPVMARAEEVPLDEFLASLSDEYEVSVALSPDALVRLKPHPRVNITLAKPISLRSLLALLAGFHGLTPEVDDQGVLLK